MGKRLRSIAFITLAATLLSSTVQANPSGNAIEPKSGSMVCVEGHYNADHNAFICDATKPKSETMVCFDGHQNADLTFTCDQFIESQQWFEGHIHKILDNVNLEPTARKAVFILISYEAPYGGSYDYLSVNAAGQVGMGFIATKSSGEDCHNCFGGLIDTRQLTQFEQKINQLSLAPQTEYPKGINGKTYMVILVQRHGTIVRRDYANGLPPDLNRFVEETNFFVKKAIEKALSESFGKPLK